MSERNALANMPIWIDRCNLRAHCIKRVEGTTYDCQQLIALRDYMREVVANG